MGVCGGLLDEFLGVIRGLLGAVGISGLTRGILGVLGVFLGGAIKGIFGGP